MTHKQRTFFAAKLAKMGELASLAKQGEDYEHFASRIESDLLHNDKKSFYLPYLEKINFYQQ